MARPKRPRPDAVVVAPPTTRRRRSQLPEVLGMGVPSNHRDDPHPARRSSTGSRSTGSTGNSRTTGRTMDDPTTTGSMPRENPKIHATALMGDNFHHPTAAAAHTTVRATADDTTTTTGNDLPEEEEEQVGNVVVAGGDHLHTQKKTSLVDIHTQREEEFSSFAPTLHHNNNNNNNTRTDHSVTSTRKRIVTNYTSDHHHHHHHEDNEDTPATTSQAVSCHDETTLPTSTIPAAAAAAVEPENMIPLDPTVKNEPTRNAAEQPHTFDRKWRKEHVVALLEHRQMLLLRVRQCRQVSERRLSTQVMKSMDQEKETVMFTDTMKQVLSLARKQARLEQQQQRDGGGNHHKHTGSGSNNNNHHDQNKNNNNSNITTTTVSLRRGNSVGKRMNAAISTLTGVASHHHHPQPQHGSSGMGPLQLVAASSYRNNHKNGGGGDDDGTEEGPPPPTRGNAAPSRLVPPKSQRVHHSLAAPGARPPSQRPRSHPADGHSIHPQQQQYTSSQQQQQQQQQNRVICPETMALRNRRDEIRNMLSTLLKQRQHPKLDKIVSLSERRNSLMSHVSSSSLSPRSTVLSSKPISVSLHRTCRHGNDKVNHKLPSSSSSPIPIWENPHGPPNLPPRRKTHWDTVLEEMRWMATDFIEEQKWKYATCRVLSMQASAVVSSSRKKKLPPPPTNPPAPPLIANAMDITTHTRDSTIVDEPNTNVVQESRATPIKINSSVALSHFQSMTIDDSISAKHIAQQISDIVSNMVHLNNLSFASSIANNAATRHPMAPSTNNAPLNRVDTTDPTLDVSKQKAEFMQRVSLRIDNVMKLTSEQEFSTNEITTATEETCDIQPTMEQNKILQMIEDRWQRIGIGTVLHGPRASGKTILACSVMYRNRTRGPQLLLCSSESLIRWTHELDNFKGLHVKQWNESESCSTSMESFVADDVLVCPRSSVVHLRWDDLAKFSAIILDCRYADQSSPSLWSDSRTEQSICVPYDVSSQVWWKKIIDIVSNCDISRRLLVDSFESDSTLTYLRGLTSKEFLTVTALRTAFLVGPKCFNTTIYPIEKAILAWARHRTKQDATASVGSKFSQVSALLTKICESCRSKADWDVDNLDCIGNFVTYDVRFCTMTKKQRVAYDRACQQSRLLLSQELDKQNEKLCEDVATSLLLLRRHCVHSNIQAILERATVSRATVHPTGDVDSESHKYQTQQLLGQNAAQPNLELAYKILSGSSKLRQLVSILHDNEGYMAFGHSGIKCVGIKKSSDGWTSNPVEHRKKIVIIASQPDIQLLVSCLLHSIGIHHEILLTNGSAQSALNPALSKDSGSWLSVQVLLSKFNGRGGSNSQIVITSLAVVEGDRVGLGIEAADSIVILDEDWSGQEERLLHSVLSRCFQKRKSIGKSGVHVTRLVTESTCEDVFLRHKTEDLADNLTSWFKRHYSAGVSNSYTSINRTVAPSLVTNRKRDAAFLIYCFPGQNILRHRNLSLDDVVKPTRSLSRLHSHSTHGRFLPIESEHDLADIESMITSCLIRLELCSRGNYDKIERLPQVAAHDIQSWHEENICLPPTPLRDFVRRQYKAMVLQESGPIFSLSNLTLATKGVTSAVEASDHIDRATKPVLATSPIDAAVSILMYNYDTANIDLGPVTGSAISHRGNRYAATFSTTSGVSLRRDGNQGVESLVYFPPIFPKLRECVDTAIAETGLTLQHQTPQDGEADGCSNTASVHKEGAESIYLEADSGLAVAGVFPSFQDSVAHAAGILVYTGSSSVKSIDTLNDWLSSFYPTNAEEYQEILQDRITNKSMQSVILMVTRKRQRGQSNSSYQARYGTGVWSGISGSISDMSRTIDANGANKKGKKVVSAFNRLPLVDAPQHSRPTTFASQRKDDYRHRLLMTLRQSSTSSGSTIFDAPIFRVAAFRIRDKISARLQSQNWITSSTRVNDKSCSGLPIAFRTALEGVSNSGTTGSIVGHSDVSTEILDRQINEMARQQTISFQKSHFEPRRVDFGPFHTGFVSSMTGMTSVTYPRPRIGVTLPMGVKISIISKEQTSAQWSQDMDRILMHTITRFGSNWLLASLVLKGFFGVPNSHKESPFYSIPCAPRTCRDRWRLLTRDEESQNRSTGSSRDIQLGGDTGLRILVSKRNSLESSRKHRIVGTYLLVPSSIDDVLPTRKGNGTSLRDEPSSPTKRKSSRRTFTAFKHGLGKQQQMPMPISGVTSVVAPCHPSHETTVQRSTMAVNGRTDMWPLQILDGAERLRSAAAASSVNIESISSTSSQSGVPSRRPVTVNMPTRVHSSTNNNGRSGVPPPNHRSHSTTAAPIPLQRTTSSNSTSASQRPSSQHSHQPTNHVTASKQRFVPPVPPSKVVSTPKVQISTSNGVQIATSNPMPPPQTMTSEKPSKSMDATNITVSQPSAPVVSAAKSEAVASKYSNGTIASDQPAPSKALSVTPQQQVPVSPEVDHKVTTTPKPAAESTLPSHKSESNVVVPTTTTATIPALSGDVSATTTTSEIPTTTGAVAVATAMDSSAAVPASNQP